MSEFREGMKRAPGKPPTARQPSAAAFAALGAIAGFAFGPDPATQPPAIPAPGQLSCLVGPHPLAAPATGQA